MERPGQVVADSAQGPAADRPTPGDQAVDVGHDGLDPVEGEATVLGMVGSRDDRSGGPDHDQVLTCSVQEDVRRVSLRKQRGGPSRGKGHAPPWQTLLREPPARLYSVMRMKIQPADTLDSTIELFKAFARSSATAGS